MARDRAAVKARLVELARIQKERHLSSAELWEAADLLRAAGKEGAAQEAEAAALRQRARENSQSPDATFALGEEVDELEVCYCRECGRQISRAEAEASFYLCQSCLANQS